MASTARDKRKKGNQQPKSANKQGKHTKWGVREGQL